MTKKIEKLFKSYRDQLVHLAKLYGVVEIKSYARSSKRLTISQLELLLMSINSETGTMGHLINNDSLYNELANTLHSMDQLLIDIKENPKKYVNLSLWGGDKKSDK